MCLVLRISLLNKSLFICVIAFSVDVMKFFGSYKLQRKQHRKEHLYEWWRASHTVNQSDKRECERVWELLLCCRLVYISTSISIMTGPAPNFCWRWSIARVASSETSKPNRKPTHKVIQFDLISECIHICVLLCVISWMKMKMKMKEAPWIRFSHSRVPISIHIVNIGHEHPISFESDAKTIRPSNGMCTER